MTTEQLLSDISCLQDVLAHVSENRVETWKEHTDLCLKYYDMLYQAKRVDDAFERLCSNAYFNFSDTWKSYVKDYFRDMIVYHDVGKLNPKFQKQKMKNGHYNYRFAFAKDSDHSLLSAVIYLQCHWNTYSELSKSEQSWLDYFAIVFAYLISRHHGSLDNLEGFVKHLRVKSRRWANQVWQQFANLSAVDVDKVVRRWMQILPREKDLSHMDFLKLMEYIRLGSSLLVTSDFYATSEFMTGVVTDDLGFMENVHAFRDAYENTDVMKSVRQHTLHSGVSMNDLRSDILLESESVLRQNLDKSVFYLKAPTGSGKTNTSLNLGLTLLEQDSSLQKIIYVYPFNTLVEQSMQVMQQTFGSNLKLQSECVVLNSVTPITFKDSYEKSLLQRQFCNYSWIVTTHVHLFDMLFGDSRSSVFGYHQLMNSVIILDEIQSYRQDIWTEIAYYLQSLSELLNIKFIITSATLPNFDKLVNSVCNSVNLLPNSDKYFQNVVFRQRVVVHDDLSDASMDDLLQHVGMQIEQNKKILVEFMTKSEAFSFYQKAQDMYGDIYCVECMTGDDNRLERSRIINQTKQSDGLVLISTQVIEAGVDIDMDVGYKAVSKLDSEKQFMGRINRSMKHRGDVWFFQARNPEGIYRDDIRIAQDLRVTSVQMHSLLVDDDFDTYYDKVFERLRRKNNRFDKDGLDRFFLDVRQLNFKAMRKRMELIHDSNWTQSVFFMMDIYTEDGVMISGEAVWNEYMNILHDFSIPYAEKQVRLSRIRSKFDYFVCSIPKKWIPVLLNDDQVVSYSDMLCVMDGSRYFQNGKVDRSCFTNAEDDALIL